MSVLGSIVIGIMVACMIFAWPILFAFMLVLLQLAFYVVIIGTILWIIGEAVKYILR